MARSSAWYCRDRHEGRNHALDRFDLGVAHVPLIGEQGTHDFFQAMREKRQSLLKAAMKNFAVLLANA